MIHVCLFSFLVSNPYVIPSIGHKYEWGSDLHEFLTSPCTNCPEKYTCQKTQLGDMVTWVFVSSSFTSTIYQTRECTYIQCERRYRVLLQQVKFQEQYISSHQQFDQRLSIYMCIAWEEGMTMWLCTCDETQHTNVVSGGLTSAHSFIYTSSLFNHLNRLTSNVNLQVIMESVIVRWYITI